MRALAKARRGSEDHQVQWLSPGACPPLSAKRRCPLGPSPWLSGLRAPSFPSHLTVHSHAFAGLRGHPDPFQMARRTRRLIPGCPGPSWMCYTLLLIFTLSRDPERKMLQPKRGPSRASFQKLFPAIDYVSQCDVPPSWCARPGLPPTLRARLLEDACQMSPSAAQSGCHTDVGATP